MIQLFGVSKCRNNCIFFVNTPQTKSPLGTFLFSGDNLNEKAGAFPKEMRDKLACRGSDFG